MARPRFLLVARTAAARRPWLWWLDGTGGAADGGPADDTAAVEGVAWRLAGGNNRELGRSALVHPDAPACIASALELQAALGRAERVVALHELTGLWGWRLDLDGRPAAASARLYPRRREATYSATQFVAAAALATVTTEVMRVERTGRAYVAPRPRSADRPADRPADRRAAPPGTPPAGPQGPPAGPQGPPAGPQGPPAGPQGPPAAPQGLPAAPQGLPAGPRDSHAPDAAAPAVAAAPRTPRAEVAPATFTAAMSGVHTGVPAGRPAAASVVPATAPPPRTGLEQGTGEIRRG